MSTLLRTKTPLSGIFPGPPSAGEGALLQKAGDVFVEADLTLKKAEGLFFKHGPPQKKAEHE